ncbi:hypothetical protein pb186bvf_012277 [Paramecium bursaria]
MILSTKIPYHINRESYFEKKMLNFLYWKQLNEFINLNLTFPQNLILNYQDSQVFYGSKLIFVGQMMFIYQAWELNTNLSSEKLVPKQVQLFDIKFYTENLLYFGLSFFSNEKQINSFPITLFI